MPTEKADTLEDLVRAGAARAHRRNLVLIALSSVVGLAGILAAVWGVRVSDSNRVALHTASVAAQTALQQEHAEKLQVSGLLQKGAAQAHEGHYAQADQFYDRALKADPNNPTALQLKGYLRLRQGDVSNAITFLKRAVAANPLDPWAHYNLALALYRSGDTNGAVDQVKQLLSIDPDFRNTIAQNRQFARLREEPALKQLLAQTR